MSTSDYKSVRVPVIPLDYNSRFLAEKKEILFDYNTGQLYVVSAEDKNVIFNITDVVLEKVQEGIDLDNLIINVEGIGDVNLSEYIEYLNKYNLTLSDNDSKQYYAPTVKFDNMSIILCDGEATVSGFKYADNDTYAVKQDNLIKWVPISDRLNVPTQAITDNSTKVANTEFVQSAVDNKISQLVNSVPETLETLNGLSNALGNDPNLATTISNMIGQKADKTGGGASGTWGINITGTATNADKLDGVHENSFLRYRGQASVTGEDTLWSQIGIKQYSNMLPKGIRGTYNYGAVVSLPSNEFRLDIWYNHHCSENGEGLWYRSGWYYDQRAWAKLLDSNNFNIYAPTKTGTGASGTWDINISGTATKATQDGNGNVIANTYLKKAGDTVTGTLNVPTQAITDNSTKVANTEFVQSAVDNKISQLVNSVPETLETLNGLSNALGNDPNLATTISNMIGQKADKTSVDNKIARHNTDGTAHEDIRQMFNNYLTREETAKEIESAESAATRASERFYQSMRYDIVGPTPEYITVANFIVGAGPAAIASS